MKTLVREAKWMPEARRLTAALFIAAAPMLYVLPGGAMHYLTAWESLFNGTAIIATVWLSAGMALGCYAIPLAAPVCIVMSAA